MLLFRIGFPNFFYVYDSNSIFNSCLGACKSVLIPKLRGPFSGWTYETYVWMWFQIIFMVDYIQNIPNFPMTPRNLWEVLPLILVYVSISLGGFPFLMCISSMLGWFTRYPHFLKMFGCPDGWFPQSSQSEFEHSRVIPTFFPVTCWTCLGDPNNLPYING